MAQFASDDFTGTSGTELSAYNSAWTRHTSYSRTCIITDDNRLKRSSGGANDSSVYYHSGTPASADYSVSADLFAKETDGGESQNGVCGRISTSANTFYMARYAGSTVDGWQLYKIVGGAGIQLGSTISASITDETSKNIKLEMIGDAIKVYIDGSGTPVISVTDGAITAAGKAGFRFAGVLESNTTGLHLDNFSADDIGGVTYTLYSPTMVYSAGSWYPQVGETVA